MLLVKPPPLGRPSAIKRQSMSITIGLSDLICDGGHTISSFTIRYKMQSYFSTFRYIRNIDPNRRNYTITELEPSSLYAFQVRAVNVDSIGSYFSSRLFVSTLPPGKYSGSIIIPSVFVHYAMFLYNFFFFFFCVFTGPSPPRNVTAKLIAPGTVEVRWRVPALSNGVIIRFTVYAIPVRANGATRGKRQIDDTPQTIQTVKSEIRL